MWKRHWPIVLILLLAFGLRLYALTALPPGLTHDEANHGREAIGILDGILLYYFPLNYGSEPLYSYTVAVSMHLFGENLFALRLVNVIFGVAAIGVTYVWVCRAFDRRQALLTAVLMAVSFWPLAASRQALRAGILPFFMTGAVWFFWKMITAVKPHIPAAPSSLLTARQSLRSLKDIIWPTVLFGICVAVTLHIYLAARVAWGLFPLFLIYLLLVHRDLGKQLWLPTLVGLLLAGILAAPLFLYIQRYPYVLTRLDMLAGPVQALQTGNVLPLLQNSAAALLAFIWPGYGDHFLAYNMPGRPVFDSLTALFFVVGVLVSVWRWQRPNYAFLLLWFGVGIIPSLITGPTANTTRNLAALPPTFVLPAVGFWALVAPLKLRIRQAAWRPVLIGSLAFWLLFAGGTAVRDYFLRWGQSPDVRGAYQRNLVESLAYLADHTLAGATVLSTVYPGPAHDPSIALVLSGAPNQRWVDARYAFILPENQDALAVIPASTPPHPAFARFLQPVETVSLRPDDLDAAFTIYEVKANALTTFSLDTAVNLNNGLTLRHAHWLNPIVQPGETAELLTIWEVTDPANLGPVVPPAFTTDMVMFTQLLNEAGQVWAQRDALDAPSWDWQTGDMVLQIHPIIIPTETANGSFPALIGMYDRQSGERLPVLNQANEWLDDKIDVLPLQVNTP